jgi:exopolysaccharide biosynthesis polyprenyl glycosylphosphotransferase
MAAPIRTPVAQTAAAGAAAGERGNGAAVRTVRLSGVGPRSLVGARVASLAGDLLLVCANGAVVFYLRFFREGHVEPGVSITHYLAFLALYAALVGVFCQNQGLYQTWRSTGPLDESFSILKAVFLATLLLTAFIYLSGDKTISRLVVGFSGVLNAVTLPAWRFWKREIVKHRVASGKDGRHVLIVGAGDVGRALARHFEENKYLGYVVKGFLEQDGKNGTGVIGGIDDLHRLALMHFADEIFITTPSERDLVARVVLEARQYHLDVKVVPEMFDGLGLRAPIRYVGDFPVMELLREPIPAFGLLVKRIVDVSGAALGLVALAPVFALLAIAIRLDSPGSAVYSSSRMGRKGRKFPCYKFRTMVANADEIKDGLRHMNERDGPFFKITNDPRLTRIGGFLRRYSLDELPQLWNVFKGEMSLVGPRPHPLDDYEQYRLEDLRRLDVKPGITGLWQVYGRRDPSFEKNMTLDLEYIETWSLWLDIKILLKTLPAAASGSGA